MKKTQIVAIIPVLLGVIMQATTRLSAQQSVAESSITGIAATRDKHPVPFASLGLFGKDTLRLIKAAIADQQGVFRFDNIPSGEYFIYATCSGYGNEKYGPFTVSGASPAQLTIIMSKEAVHLRQVQITARKPLIEQKFGKLIVNVENSVLNAGNSVWEILQKSPGIMVDDNGSISLKGKSGVTVMINDKLTYLSQQQLKELLKSMRSETVSQLEIITNPSSKYDAAGSGGILNIKLRKNESDGWKGSVSLGYTQAKYAQQEGGGRISYRKNKVSFYSGYSTSIGNSWNEFNTNKRFYDNGGKTLAAIQTAVLDGKYKSYTQSFRGGLDYDFNKRNNVGIMVNVVDNQYKTLGLNGPVAFYNPSGKKDSSSYSTNTGNSGFRSFTLDLNYRLLTDTLDGTLTANFDYSKYNFPGDQLFGTNFYDAVGNISRLGEQRRGMQPISIDIRSIKLDYSLNLKGRARLEAGIKVSDVNNDNDLHYDWLSAGEWKYDTSMSNHFIYRELISAGYFNFSKELGHGWGIQLGLRGEQTSSRANQVTAGTIVKRNYFSLFPSAVIQRTLNESHSLSVSYSRRIDRPDYQSQNPFIYIIDQYNYRTGNAYLKPQFSNNIELSYIFKGTYFVSLAYSHTRDAITNTIRQIDSSRKTYQLPDNLNSLDNLTLSLNAPVTFFKWWNCNNSVNIYYNQYMGHLNNDPLHEGTATFYINSNHVFLLPVDIKGELNGFYQSSQRSGAFVLKPVYMISAGIGKNWWNNKFSAKLTVNDIFNLYRVSSYQLFGGIDTRYDNFQQSRKLILYFNYNFGNNKVKSGAGKSNGIESEVKRIRT
ncbi:MAG TPA: TonB-dependent receptor [Chitinophaga sp.]|uniref:TonB-dependent receptor domain-containing protein n=1 Tax=Chitinophaga sp. TaxID=1869181 RepID=UPI002B763AE9|nr:TonB-dependent receptor [Chitinophaga sp.]HVI49408.1 TonB-dependent receptor [Chitinophaga sp.]